MTVINALRVMGTSWEISNGYVESITKNNKIMIYPTMHNMEFCCHHCGTRGLWSTSSDNYRQTSNVICTKSQKYKCLSSCLAVVRAQSIKNRNKMKSPLDSIVSKNPTDSVVYKKVILMWYRQSVSVSCDIMKYIKSMLDIHAAMF